MRMSRRSVSIRAILVAALVSLSGCSDDDSGNGNDNLNQNQNDNGNGNGNGNVNGNENNTPPEAVDDFAEVVESHEIVLGVLENDLDADGDPLTIASLTAPLRGRAELLADGSIRYVPFPHFNGADELTYTVEDGRGGQDTATVFITVTPVGEDLFVAPGGQDTNPGTMDEPFATLERARTEIRAFDPIPAGGVTVWLRQGVYERSQTFDLAAQDSGTAGAPVVISGYPGESVRLVGGKVLDPSAFSLTDSSSPVWSRLDPSAQGQVVELDLQGAGVADYGALVPRGFSVGGATAALELFFDGKPMQLARWPDEDEHQAPVTSADSQFTLYGASSPDVSGVYVATGTSDGVNSYERQGLVGGLQYRIYRRTWDYQGSTYTAWFITTNESGYPSNTNPWWYRYEEELGAFSPSEAASASGSPTTKIPGQINWGFAAVETAVSDTQFTYYGSRPERWTGADDVWFHGYWVYHWADRTMNAVQIDTTTRTVTLASVPGYGIEAGQPYFAFNLLEEITRPGEWYLDRSTGTLYFWPPSDPAASETIVSVMESSLIRLSDAEGITIQNLTLEATRSTLVDILGGQDNLLYKLHLRNAGTNAVYMSGARNSVERCEIENPGDGGVLMAGGDRPSLAPGESSVRNCHIHHFSRFSRTYTPGVRLSGIGHLVEHNWIHDAPHSAILYGGNEHTIAFNDIHDVCQWTSDAGAVYAGRDWGFRGNEVRFNFIHHIRSDFEGYGVHGIYLDDCLSGIHVFGNVLYEITGHGILHGGGRDNVMENNLMVRCGSGLSSDSRGLVAIVHDGSSWDLLQKIVDMSYQQEPWATAYPALAAIPNDWAQISDPANTWRYPEGCVFSRNLGFANARFMRESLSGGTGTFDKFAQIQDNLEDADPLFVDEAGGDLTLSPASPALAIPGFTDIPFGEIGIQPE